MALRKRNGEAMGQQHHQQQILRNRTRKQQEGGHYFFDIDRTCSNMVISSKTAAGTEKQQERTRCQYYRSWVILVGMILVIALFGWKTTATLQMSSSAAAGGGASSGAVSSPLRSRQHPHLHSSLLRTKKNEYVNEEDVLVAAAISMISKVSSTGVLSQEREVELLQLAHSHDPQLLAVMEELQQENNLNDEQLQQEQFLEKTNSIGSLGQQKKEISHDNSVVVGVGSGSATDVEAAAAAAGAVAASAEAERWDAVVVGSGLAGLAAALNILDRGGRVIIFEKEATVGGNSNRASSGINGCCLPEDAGNGDSMDLFRADTVASAGNLTRMHLIDTLVQNSGDAVSWLKQRVGVDLSKLAQLGGHSVARTHRPAAGMVGAEIIYGIQSAVESYAATGKVKLVLQTKVTRLLSSDDGDDNGTTATAVRGVAYVKTTATATGNNSDMQEIEEEVLLAAPAVILATGGFAADRSADSYMQKYRPDLMNVPTTAGLFSTGDGVSLGTSAGAAVTDMDQVQVHPTGWVDPANPNSGSKVLAAELLRGVGGILLSAAGERFCNELGTRAYIADKMFAAAGDPVYAATGRWNPSAAVPTYTLLLSAAAAEEAAKHIDMYVRKGLVRTFHGTASLAAWMNVTETAIITTLQQYREYATAGVPDPFGKTTYNNVPKAEYNDEVFYAGTVIPVVHYCMGGLKINEQGSVLKETAAGNAVVIRGLHAAGEVTGGVHGANRLGGNSLLECAVFGTIVGRKVPVQQDPVGGAGPLLQQKTVSMAELQQHAAMDDCWVAVHGVVYDLTKFAMKHPGLPEKIWSVAGKDGTNSFMSVHSDKLLHKIENMIVGKLNDPATATATAPTNSKTMDKIVSMKELQQHASMEDCWVAVNGVVYDLTKFAMKHPGLPEKIWSVAGKDGTNSFRSVHSDNLLQKIESMIVGKLNDPTQQAQQELPAAAVAAVEIDPNNKKNGDDAAARADTKQQHDLPVLSLRDLKRHNSAEDCWVAIHDVVYDLTAFAPKHPGLPENIWKLAGQNATAPFSAVHSDRILHDFGNKRMGRLPQQHLRSASN